MFKTIGAHVAPPAGVKPPSQWGDEERIRQLFGAAASSITMQRRHFNFRYRSAQHFVDVFRTFYGPTHKAFGALPAAGAQALERDLLALLGELDVGGARGLVVPSEYLEVVIVKA
jgi:hypothetical protein